jgi:hypothetical protein
VAGSQQWLLTTRLHPNDKVLGKRGVLDWMWKEVGKEDRKTLREIAAALGKVGSQLNAADKVRGHDPWSVIARQEATVRSLTELLSGRFRRMYSDLVQRLSTCTNLHLVWGGLQDEVRQIIESMEQ